MDEQIAYRLRCARWKIAHWWWSIGWWSIIKHGRDSTEAKREAQSRWLREPSRPKPPNYSEFGRGLLVCLLGFLDHKSQIERWQRTEKIIDTDTAIRTWANGASDHLYELTIPERLQGTPLAARIAVFKSKWLEIGHGFGLDRMDHSQVDWEQVHAALLDCERMVLEVAAELDRALGLKDAKVGEWT